MNKKVNTVIKNLDKQLTEIARTRHDIRDKKSLSRYKKAIAKVFYNTDAEASYLQGCILKTYANLKTQGGV